MSRYAYGWSDPRVNIAMYASNYTKHDERIAGYLQAKYKHNRKYSMFLSFTRFATAAALNEAERAGREFSPIFWYMTDDDEIIMTLWSIDSCFIQSTTNTMTLNTAAANAAMLLRRIAGNSGIEFVSHAASLSLFQHAPHGASSNRTARAHTCWSHLRRRSALCLTPTRSNLGPEKTDKLSFISTHLWRATWLNLI